MGVDVGSWGFCGTCPTTFWGGEDAVVEGPRAAGAASAVQAGRRVAEHLHAVQLGAGEVRTQAPQRNLSAFAAVTGDRDAGDALQRLRQVLVGKGADVLGENDLLRPGRRLLSRQGAAQARSKASDDDLVKRRDRLGGIGGLNDRAGRDHGSSRRRRRRRRARATGDRHRPAGKSDIDRQAACQFGQGGGGSHRSAQRRATQAFQDAVGDSQRLRIGLDLDGRYDRVERSSWSVRGGVRVGE